MKNKLQLLYNPFGIIAGWKAFAIGLPIVCITVIVGFLNNVFFPGVLDIKFATGVSLHVALISQLIGLASTIFVLYIASLIFAKGTRFQDIAGTATLARYPMLISALSGIIVNEESIDNLKQLILYQSDNPTISNYTGLIIASLLSIFIVVWHVALLYNAFRVSAGMSSPKCIIVFIVSVIVAEVLSLIGILLFNLQIRI